jgi:protein TonB
MAKEMPAHEQDFVVPSNSPQSQQPPIAANTAVAAPAEADVTETLTTSTSKSQSTHTEEADPTEAWNGYGQMLYEWISKNKNYPDLAIRRRWEGRAKVIARFDQGKLISVSILESGSGHQVLDDAALETLRKAANALPVKGKLENKSFTVVIPLNFKLEG